MKKPYWQDEFVAAPPYAHLYHKTCRLKTGASPERGMQSKPTTNSEEQPEIDARMEVSTEVAQPGLEMPVPPAKREWNNEAEQEWSEHSTTAWALAHVIHRICSTPLPPFLPPEQQRHFQKVVQMAAALMEEWQRRERDQAQQLVAHHPFADAANEILMESQTIQEMQPAEEPVQKVGVGSEQK
jgi:hypothetical protein